jgi:hypothetical protein
MPRRNRNVRAYRIDTDELADQAAQLTAEIGTTYAALCRADEMQVYPILGGSAGTWKSACLRAYLRKALNASYGYSLSVIDGKAVTSHGRN